MSDLLKYKGYEAAIEFDAEDRLFFGKVLHVDSLLMFHGQSVDELEKAFHEVIDEYLAYCEREGVEPNKPYRGSFNVRIGPERHRRLAREAARRGISLNEMVCCAIDVFLDHGEVREPAHHNYYLIQIRHSLPLPGARDETPWFIYEGERHVAATH